MKYKPKIGVAVDDSLYHALKEIFPVHGTLSHALRSILRWIVDKPNEALRVIERYGEEGKNEI